MSWTTICCLCHGPMTCRSVISRRCDQHVVNVAVCPSLTHAILCCKCQLSCFLGQHGHAVSVGVESTSSFYEFAKQLGSCMLLATQKKWRVHFLTNCSCTEEGMSTGHAQMDQIICTLASSKLQKKIELLNGLHSLQVSSMCP